MADDLECRRIFSVTMADRGVMIDRMTGIDQPAVDTSRDRSLGQAGTDAGGDIGHSDGVRVAALEPSGRVTIGIENQLPGSARFCRYTD